MMDILYYILFLVSVALAFFMLFTLSKNDFVLMRRSVSLPQIFDNAFIALVVGFAISRIFFIFDSFLFTYLYSIQFLHIFLYPGLSLIGFYIGLVIILFYFYLKLKAFSRAFDLYLVSFFWVLVAYIFFVSTTVQFGVLNISLLAASLVFFAILVHFYKHFTLRDGSIGLMSISFIFSMHFVLHFSLSRHVLIESLSFTQLVDIFIVALSVILFILNEKFILRR